MSLLENPIPPTLTKPRPHRMTVFEYEQLVSTGALEGQRVELLEGEMIDMPPMSQPHGAAILKLSQYLRSILTPGTYVREQMPLRVPGASMPEPDVAWVEGTFDDAPKRALLVAEICLSTEDVDRGRKPFLYAAAEIPEYWLVDVGARMIEIYRSPEPDNASPTGWLYRRISRHDGSSLVATLVRPADQVLVASLLPIQA